MHLSIFFHAVGIDYLLSIVAPILSVPAGVSPLKNENLRLLEFVGSGRTSVSHARTLAETYDSDIVRCHGLNVPRKHGINK